MLVTCMRFLLLSLSITSVIAVTFEDKSNQEHVESINFEQGEIKNTNMEKNRGFEEKNLSNPDLNAQIVRNSSQINVKFLAEEEKEENIPRFFDEIADELNILENKKDSLFSRHRLRKILIPTLIILKLFKLKLLLFLPLILGLASFKKFLGFLAIVIPVFIGFFKFFKPLMTNYKPPVYTQSGIGYPYYKEYLNGNHEYPVEMYASYQELPAIYHQIHHTEGGAHGSELAYQGYKPY